ncbi:MAG: flagellar biosynthetic protein FliO [Candidatus Korobacteraceae bacterium]
MSQPSVRQNSVKRSRKGAFAIRRSRVGSDSAVKPSPVQPGWPARLHALLLQGVGQLNGLLRKQRRQRRKLQLLELQQLGEKRFVAIVRVGKQKFLIGGAATSVSLLAEIEAQRAKVIAPRPLGQERA